MQAKNVLNECINKYKVLSTTHLSLKRESHSLKQTFWIQFPIEKKISKEKSHPLKTSFQVLS